MPRTISLHPLSLLVGVGLCLLGLVAMGQAPVKRAPGGDYAAASPIHGLGNLHPRDMVQIYPPGNYPSGGLFSIVSIPAGGVFEVYAVPADRWLVLVPSSWSGNAGAGYSGSNNVGLYEDRGGQLFEKSVPNGVVTSNQAGPGNDVLGWTFAPGSRVVLKNLDPTAAALAQYNFFGYTTGL